MPADLLFLNASNWPGNPIFPYAFVQVSAVARRHGLSVVRRDLFGQPPAAWPKLVAELIATHRPRLVGVHLRQLDSIVGSEYGGAEALKRPPTFFPVEHTRDLVAAVRAATDVPVVAGGIGFTTMAGKLVDRLGVDFGVEGCADGFFARFEDVLARRDLATVPNLWYRDGDQVLGHARTFFAPNERPEYDDAIMAELKAFYGEEFGTPRGPHVAVEFMRGCPFRCTFCVEPRMKGTDVRLRDLDVIEAELDFLEGHGANRIWFICSELNLTRATKEHTHALADRLIARQARGKAPIQWSAYVLPGLEPDELAHLKASGYQTRNSTIVSLDDANLKQVRVPYRAKTLVELLRDDLPAVDRSRAATDAARAQPPAARLVTRYLVHHLDAPWEDPVAGEPRHLTAGIFLGNTFADGRSVRATLEGFAAEGLPRQYLTTELITSTRIYTDEEVAHAAAVPGATVSYRVGGGALDVVDLTAPTFQYAPELVKVLGSREATDAFLTYATSTFLTSRHIAEKTWGDRLRAAFGVDGYLALLTASAATLPAVLDAAGVAMKAVLAAREARGLRANHPAAGAVMGFLGDVCLRPAPPLIDAVFKTGPDKPLENHVAALSTIVLLAANLPRTLAVLDHLGLAHDDGGLLTISELEVYRTLARTHATNDDVRADVHQRFGDPRGLEALACEYTLLDANVELDPRASQLLCA